MSESTRKDNFICLRSERYAQFKKLFTHVSDVHLISREPIWLQKVSTARECMILIAVIYYSVVLWWQTVTLQLLLNF